MRWRIRQRLATNGQVPEQGLQVVSTHHVGACSTLVPEHGSIAPCRPRRGKRNEQAQPPASHIIEALDEKAAAACRVPTTREAHDTEASVVHRGRRPRAWCRSRKGGT